MLQEVTLSSEQLNLIVARFGYKAETNVDIVNPAALGTGFVWKTGLPVSEVYNVVECRSQVLKLGNCNFANIYAPSGSQNRQSRRTFFGEDIFRIIRGIGKSIPILGGDFNCVLSPLDTESNFNDKKCPALKDLVDNFNYSDAYRHLDPAGQEFTFCRPSCSASRLDRFYVPQDLLDQIISVKYNASLSDHRYVVLLISLPGIENLPDPVISSSSYWKLNTSILKDEDFLENFSIMYQKLKLKVPEYSNIADWWNLCAKPDFKKYSS